MVDACLVVLKKTDEDITSDKKAALWKVMIATLMRERTSVSNV
jgi:hypothetical protein